MLQCYDFVKCETCGINWDVHDPSCANHHFRDERIAGQATLSDREKDVLKKGGWTPPDEQSQTMAALHQLANNGSAIFPMSGSTEVVAVVIPSVYAPYAPSAPVPSLGSLPEIQTVFQGCTTPNGHGIIK